MAYNRFFYSYFSFTLLCDYICLFDVVAGVGTFYLAAELDLIDFMDMGSKVFAVTRCPRSLTVYAGCGFCGPDFLTT